MSSNPFEKLINSFKTVTNVLEKKAELNLEVVQKECEEDFRKSVKSLEEFNELMSGISEACSELANSNDILKLETIKCTSENAINLPHEMQSDWVKYIRELYNMRPIVTGSYDNKLITEGNQQSVKDLIKMCETNIREVKDVENTIIEAKEII